MIFVSVCVCVSGSETSNMVKLRKFICHLKWLKVTSKYKHFEQIFCRCVGYKRVRKVKCLIVSGCRMFCYTCCWNSLKTYLRSFCFLSLNITRVSSFPNTHCFMLWYSQEIMSYYFMIFYAVSHIMCIVCVV